MNDTVALAPQDVGSTGLNDLLALVGLPSQRRATAELSGSAEEIFNGISSFIDGVLLRCIGAQTAKEFVSARKEAFRQYSGAVTGLAQLVRIVVPNAVVERVVAESFCQLEADFREEGLARFGAAANDQARFTIWTLRRASRLISKIVSSGPVPAGLKQQDEQLAAQFSRYAAWTQFHLDCMLIAIRANQPIQLEVLEEIRDRLRSAVNAYGYARQGLDLRAPQAEPNIPAYEMDDEDRELMNSSMDDMAEETLDD